MGRVHTYLTSLELAEFPAPGCSSLSIWNEKTPHRFCLGAIYSLGVSEKG